MKAERFWQFFFLLPLIESMSFSRGRLFCRRASRFLAHSWPQNSFFTWSKNAAFVVLFHTSPNAQSESEREDLEDRTWIRRFVRFLVNTAWRSSVKKCSELSCYGSVATVQMRSPKHCLYNWPAESPSDHPSLFREITHSNGISTLKERYTPIALHWGSLTRLARVGTELPSEKTWFAGCQLRCSFGLIVKQFMKTVHENRLDGFILRTRRSGGLWMV